MVTKKKTSKRLSPEWRDKLMRREKINAILGDMEGRQERMELEREMMTPAERQRAQKIRHFFVPRKQNPNNKTHEQPSTAQCRKIGCRELTENPFKRNQMICGVVRWIPGYLEECPKGVY